MIHWKHMASQVSPVLTRKDLRRGPIKCADCARHGLCAAQQLCQAHICT